ncbi:SPOR domain-containing protein [Salinibius halmophilus]|uniref:SPOR domain-containing protein n=1 Tax=Salinibius halmophilus TaxID=1853216 RepID=UPI000E66A66D|nr:SPOR domain-containing protein [Salinibius halmophilus]
MAEQSNKRLILRRVLGVILVVSAGALVFPRLFDGSGVVPTSQRVDIPPAPVVELPQPAEVVEYLDQEDALELLAEPTPSVQSPTPSVSTISAGWVVQLGTFSDAANAERLVENVRAAGEVAFVRDLIARDERVFYQVMVGPVAEEATARELKRQLDEQFSVAGLVLKFTP